MAARTGTATNGTAASGQATGEVTPNESAPTGTGHTDAASGGTRFIDARRRGFLQGAVIAGGAAAGGGALAGQATVDELPAAVDGTPPTSGYRETDHVREYYAKARF